MTDQEKPRRIYQPRSGGVKIIGDARPQESKPKKVKDNADT